MSYSYKRIFIYILIAIAITAAACALWQTWRTRTAAPYFAETLQAHGIHEKVVYEGREYDIGGNDGYDVPAQALSLAYHKTSARFAPLLAMPHEDPEAFIASVERLANVQERLAQKQADPEDAQRIRDGLYPIALLRAFGELEEARLAFLGRGTEYDADRYIGMQEAIFANYREAIATFRRDFIASVPKNAGQYATNTRLVSRADVLAALDELESAMIATKGVWERRTRCIRGRVGSCSETDITLPPLQALTKAPSPISAQQYAHAIEAARLFSDSEVVIDTDTFYQLGASLCVKEFPETALLFTFETTRNQEGSVSRSPFYVGDALALATAPVAELPFFEYFAKRDVEYVPARPNKYYRCPESGSESGSLIALDRIRAFALDEPISELLPGSDHADLAALQRRLTSRIVSEDDIATFISRLADPAVRAHLSPEHADRVVQLYLSLAYRSAGTPHTVSEVVHNEEMNLVLSDRGVSIEPGALFMFFARSAFVPLLLGDNMSAAGDHVALFRENTLGDDVQPTVYLSRLPRSPATRSKILQDFTFYQRVHTFDAAQSALPVSLR